MWGTQTDDEKRALSVKHEATGKVPCVPFYATGECPWDRMGSVCWRSHDHVVSDKDRNLMRKVNERREQIRADRKKDDGGDYNKDKKGKGKGKGKPKAKAEPAP